MSARLAIAIGATKLHELRQGMGRPARAAFNGEPCTQRWFEKELG